MGKKYLLTFQCKQIQAMNHILCSVYFREAVNSRGVFCVLILICIPHHYCK